MSGVAIQIFAVLLVSGLLLLGAEIFVPGGVLGAIGGFLLLGAVVAGFPAFPGYGHLVAIAILFLVGIAIALWIRIFPRSLVGQSMTVSENESNFSAAQDGLKELLGAHGEAKSALRPGGYAMINGRRIDVVTQGGMIDRGTPIEVINIASNRVVVKATVPAQGTPTQDQDIEPDTSAPSPP